MTNEDGTVATLDPAIGRVDGPPIRVGDDADGIAVGRNAVWVVALYAKRLVRIDRRRGASR